MDKNKQPKPNLPVIKTHNDEIELILKLFAVSDTLDDALENESFVKRLEAIPNAYSGVRMMNGRALQLLYDLVATLPDCKKRAILRMSKNMKYKVYFNAPVSKEKDGEVIMSNEDLGKLLKYAHQNCDICLKNSCNGCELGKVFDRTLSHYRDKDESWATWEGWVNIG